MEGEKAAQDGKFEDDSDIVHHNDKHSPNLGMLDEDYEPGVLKDNILAGRSLQTPGHVFDLNLDLDKNGETKTALTSIPASSSTKFGTVVPANSSTKPIPELKHQEVPEWSLVDIEKMGIDPM